MNKTPAAPRTRRWLHTVWWVAGVLVLFFATVILVVVVRVRERARLEALFARYGATLECEHVGPQWLRRIVGTRTLDAFGPITGLTIGSDVAGHRTPPPDRLDDDAMRKLVDELEPLDVKGVVVLGPTRAGDRGFRELRRLHGLVFLQVNDCAITDAVLADAARDWPELVRLFLINTDIGDDGAWEIAKMTNIFELRLTNAKIGDRGAKGIAKLTKLTGLYLDGTSIGDEGVAHLAKLPRLRSLTLTQTYVTEQGIATLVGRIPDLQVSDD